MQIERATLTHLELVTPLFDAYRQFYSQAPDREGARRFIGERLKHGDSVIFLALENGEGLGFTQLYPLFSSVSMRRLWLLNDLFVAPAARGGGVAAALLEHARVFAVETSAKGLTLATATSNTTAQRLYERSGYLRDEVFLHYELYV